MVNVFPGPIDDEWNQHMPPPKLAPAALANSIVKALREGVEDVYPGDVAQEWLEHFGVIAPANRPPPWRR